MTSSHSDCVLELLLVLLTVKPGAQTIVQCVGCVAAPVIIIGVGPILLGWRMVLSETLEHTLQVMLQAVAVQDIFDRQFDKY